MRFIVVGEGPSDEVLRYPTEWLLNDYGVDYTYVPVDYGHVKEGGSRVIDRLRLANQHYDPDLIILHRDANGDHPCRRIDECLAAATSLSIGNSVPCVPIRMTEAWLLFDAEAIAMAAGTRNTARVRLPTIGEAERMADPKARLRQILLDASGTKGRRRAKFLQGIGGRIHRVAENIGDYSPLRTSRSFARFEKQLKEQLDEVEPTEGT